MYLYTNQSHSVKNISVDQNSFLWSGILEIIINFCKPNLPPWFYVLNIYCTVIYCWAGYLLWIGKEWLKLKVLIDWLSYFVDLYHTFTTLAHTMTVLYTHSQHALTFEVQEATEINSLMRANTAITRMMTQYCRYTHTLILVFVK